MRCLKILLIVFLIQFISIALNANEKEIIKNIETNNDNHSFSLISLNDTKDKDNSTTSSSDNNTINDVLYKKYLKKANGFLAMGITGLILILLPVMIGLGPGLVGAIMGYNFGSALLGSYLSFGLIYILGVALTFTLPILLIIIGFNGFKHYKRLRVPNMFIGYNIKKETITLGLNCKL